MVIVMLFKIKFELFCFFILWSDWLCYVLIMRGMDTLY